MKIIFLLLDGLQDDNVAAGFTPVERAEAPSLHQLAGEACPILVETCFPGLPVGSVVANLGLLGYDPHKYFPDGRSYFELIARYDGPIGERDLILRCNTISVDEQDKIADFTAGQIPDRLARAAIDEMRRFLPEHFELYHGKNYRNAVVIRDSALRPHSIVAFSERQIAERARVTLRSNELVEWIQSGQMSEIFGGRHYDGRARSVVIKPSLQDDASKMRRSA